MNKLETANPGCHLTPLWVQAGQDYTQTGLFSKRGELCDATRQWIYKIRQLPVSETQGIYNQLVACLRKSSQDSQMGLIRLLVNSESYRSSRVFCELVSVLQPTEDPNSMLEDWVVIPEESDQQACESSSFLKLPLKVSQVFNESIFKEINKFTVNLIGEIAWAGPWLEVFEWAKKGGALGLLKRFRFDSSKFGGLSLQQISEKCPHLQHLKLIIKQSDWPELSALSNFNQLESLQLEPRLHKRISGLDSDDEVDKIYKENSANRLCDETFAYLPSIPYLQRLRCRSRWVTGENVDFFSSLTKLCHLDLAYSEQFKEAPLLTILSNNSKSLTYVNLYDCYDATDRVLEALPPSLTGLDIGLNLCSNMNYEFTNQFTDQGLKSLGKLTELLFLNLKDRICSEATLYFVIDKCKKLQSLHLWGQTNVTDDIVCNIIKLLPDLKELTLGGTSITDEALQHIRASRKLINLNISHCKIITYRGLESLANANIPTLRKLEAKGIAYSSSDPSYHEKHHTILELMPNLQKLTI